MSRLAGWRTLQQASRETGYDLEILRRLLRKGRIRVCFDEADEVWLHMGDVARETAGLKHKFIKADMVEEHLSRIEEARRTRDEGQ